MPARALPASAARAIIAAAAIGALAVGLLAGCGATEQDAAREQAIAAAAPESAVFPLSAQPEAEIVEDVPISAFGAGDGVTVDVCRPADGSTGRLSSDEARPAVLAVHGGSWARGDKSHPTWRTICQWLASSGFVGVSVNYRLAPAHPYPAAADDVTAAIAWAQDASVAAEHGIDPESIALLGGSAGGNLVSLVGLRSVASDRIEAVDAVVTLSAPLDLTVGSAANPVFEPSMLDYLACADRADCAAAIEASPQFAIVRGGPDFLVVHGTEEELIPVGQATPFALALREAGIRVELALIESSAHSVGLLDDALAERIAVFLHDRLQPATALALEPPGTQEPAP
ncbi:MAG: alpha/beta hydrolase [Microcella sp.]|uniref:alpha/beta hydrolase n=1 Tax=Microcella sp. TaxID=1913979 RepID=UPI002716B2D4|nr:alpha/beta hydrolase [Microcella sp.]MDO8337881.1 alpha/beta hydrolase [Microcella sp.]